METFDWRSFERTWTNAIVDSINKLRDAEGITVKQLRGRLADGGWELSEATLSGILSGKKRGSISVAELTIFAWALSVPPLYLMLGLPDLDRLPASPMWSERATPPSVVDWFRGRTMLGMHSDAITELGGPTDEYFVSKLTSQAMEDVATYADQVQIVQWQAAQLVALAELNDPDLAEMISHPGVRNQDFLWSAINTMSQARRNQRALDEGWRVDLGPLPEVLSFVDRDEEAEDFSIEKLRALTAPSQIQQASEFFERAIKQLNESVPREVNLGAPTDSNR